MFILGRPWGKRHQHKMDWKNLSIVRKRSDGTKNSAEGNRNRLFSKIQCMSFNKMVKKLKRWKCDLYIEKMVQTKYKIVEDTNGESAKMMKL